MTESIDALELIPDSKLRELLGRSPRTIKRWDDDPESGFPKPIPYRGRKYRRRVEVEAWMRAAAAGEVSQTAYVYKITHRESGKIYIGASCQTLETRWRHHITVSRAQNNPADSLQYAIAEHGPDAFDRVVLEKHKSKETALRRERELIAEHNSLAPNGYNIDDGAPDCRRRFRPSASQGFQTKGA
ncbi:MAG: GIY-YIG nuclease family protein [Methylocystis sp.]